MQRKCAIMYSMTETEQTVLRFMSNYQRLTGRPPTMAEIQLQCPALAWRSSVRYVLGRLVDRGLLVLVAPTNYSRRYSALEE